VAVGQERYQLSSGQKPARSYQEQRRSPWKRGLITATLSSHFSDCLGNLAFDFLCWYVAKRSLQLIEESGVAGTRRLKAA
jgi:hypothetical protein